MSSIFSRKKIKVHRKTINAFLIRLHTKNLIMLVGNNGYIMCGYLNLKVANKFRDVAVKVTGVSTINDVIKAKVHSCSNEAKRLGIKKGQSIKEVLRTVA